MLTNAAVQPALVLESETLEHLHDTLGVLASHITERLPTQTQGLQNHYAKLDPLP